MNKILSIILVLSIFLYGCSDSGNSSDGKPLSEVSAFKELSGLTSGPKGEYMVTYEMTVSGSEENFEVTTYFKDETKFRYDTMSQGMEARMYFVDGTSTMCSKDKDEFSCIQVTSQDFTNPADTDLAISEYEDELSTDETNEQYKIYRDGTITVSGHVAKCYMFEYTTIGERMCLSNEGVLLYYKSSGMGESMEFTATDYSTSVSDSVFDIPADAKIVDMNQQYPDYDQDEMDEVSECYSDCASESSDEDMQKCYMSC